MTIPEPEYPWERRPTESQPAFEAWCRYRDMNQDRTLRRVARECRKSGSLINRWSAQHEWPSRAAAWDSEQDRVRREASLSAIADMAKRHANLAIGMQVKLAERLKKLNPDELTPAHLSTWFDLAVKIERLARGEPTEIAARELSGPRGAPILPTPDRVREIIEHYKLYGVPSVTPREAIISGGNGNGNGTAGH